MNNKSPVEHSTFPRNESEQASPVQYFKHYEVLDELGRGGFGAVYLALDLRLERMVALKVLHVTLAADSTIVERFKREAKALARLAHPNIVMVYSVEDEPPPPFIVMEYVQGLTLERKLMRAAWQVKDAIHILLQVAEALDAAHEQGLIHRDIKPSNILITREKQVKLTDFGIAKMRYAEENKLTATNMTLGTVQYMAPEQSDINRQHEIGPAVDIYALGVVAYEMLAGRVPFKGDTHAVLLAHHIELPPDPVTWGANVSPSVLCVLRQVLAKDPAERYATASQFIEMLAQAASRDGINLDGSNKPLSKEPFIADGSAPTQTLHSIDLTRGPSKRSTRPLFDQSKENSASSQKTSSTAAKDHSPHEASTRQWVTPQESRDESRRQQTPSQNQPSQNQASRNQPSRNQASRNQPSRNQPPSVPQEQWRDEPSRNQPSRNQSSQNQPSRNQAPSVPQEQWRDEPSKNQASRNQPSRNQASKNQPSRNQAPSVPQEQWAEGPSRNQPSRNQAVIRPPSRQPARDLPPAPANPPIVVVHRVERSIIWSTLSFLGQLLMGTLSFLSQLLLGILAAWRLLLFVGLLLLAFYAWRNISPPELTGPDEIVSGWQEDLSMWWQETVIVPWNEFTTGVESKVTEEAVEQWAEQGGMDEISQAITDTLTAIETAATNLAPQNTPPTEVATGAVEESIAPTEVAQVPVEEPLAPTEVAVTPVEELLAPTEVIVAQSVASTEVSIAPTEAAVSPTAIPTFPFRATFVGSDFSQGCPGFYVFGSVRDGSGNLLSGVRVRAVNEYEANIPASISKKEPLGWYDIVISENEAYWDVQVVDAENNPLSEIVRVFNSGNYVEGSDACRHQVDFEQVN